MESKYKRLTIALKHMIAMRVSVMKMHFLFISIRLIVLKYYISIWHKIRNKTVAK